MRRRFSHSAVALLCLFSLQGCHTTTATDATRAKHAAPVIAGDWSQPVNGIRMAVRQIVTNTPSDDIWLLLLIENTTGSYIEWPGIVSEMQVQHAGDRAIDQLDYSANLRVVAEPLDGQGISTPQQHAVQGLERELYAQLAPGEITLHAIRLHRVEQMQALMQMNPNYIYADAMDRHNLNSQEGAGRWRLHLTYRPEGFPSAPGELREDIELEVRGWEGQQIDLPSLEIEVWSDGMPQSRQEMRER